MFCVIDYSKGARKWYIRFHDDNGMRNDRKSEYFDRELDANNRAAELCVYENIHFVQLSFDQRIKSAILSALHEAEDRETHTEWEEGMRQGEISALEELVNRYGF